jgi:ComF family protein
MSILRDFLNLFFPKICASCGNSLFRHEEVICDFCEFHLPQTNYHLYPDNPVSRIFWGRAEIEGGAAYYHFNKGNRVQHLVHLLKYKGRKDVGIYLGRQYGSCLRDSSSFDSVEVVIPVPLHRKKMLKRGYNQSEQFAIGLAGAMRIPVDTATLCRIKPTETQTRKSRFKRWENVAEIFAVSDPLSLIGKHVLLVDDVITTGATLEACINVLKQIHGIRVSVAAIAATVG